MSKNFIKRSKNTITQCTRMPYGAYNALRTLAKDHNAEIVEAENGFLTLTFDEVKTAENVANRFRADYAEAHAAYTPKEKPTKKTTKPSSTKKGKGKGNSFDFDSVKGNTKKEKNKALHAMLVGMGMGDSRTDAYQAVWTARPWAK